MYVSDISQRQRGQPNGPGLGGQTASQSQNGAGVSGGMSKAERFENEKKRIIDSCFAKKDTDGSGTSQFCC